MSSNPSSSPVQRFFRASLFFLGGVIALTIALELLSQHWVWLAVIASLSIVIYGASITIRWLRSRR